MHFMSSFPRVLNKSLLLIILGAVRPSHDFYLPEEGGSGTDFIPIELGEGGISTTRSSIYDGVDFTDPYLFGGNSTPCSSVSTLLFIIVVSDPVSSSSACSICVGKLSTNIHLSDFNFASYFW